MTPKYQSIAGALRYAGYAQTERNLGLPLEDGQIYWYNTETRRAFYSEPFLDSVLERAAGCTAVVCYNDEAAIPVVSHLQKRGCGSRRRWR